MSNPSDPKITKGPGGSTRAVSLKHKEREAKADARWRAQQSALYGHKLDDASRKLRVAGDAFWKAQKAYHNHLGSAALEEAFVTAALGQRLARDYYESVSKKFSTPRPQ